MGGQIRPGASNDHAGRVSRSVLARGWHKDASVAGDPLLAKYAQAVGQRCSPGLVITARPATSSRTNPGAITDRALVPVDLGKQSAVVRECPGVSVVNCHAANHGW